MMGIPELKVIGLMELALVLVLAATGVIGPYGAMVAVVVVAPRVLEKKLYDAREVAEITGWSVDTVRQYISRGILPAVFLGRKRMVQAAVLERICAEGLKTTKKVEVEQDA